MTREKLLKVLKQVYEEINESEYAVCYFTSDDNDVVQSLIKLLEQEHKTGHWEERIFYPPLSDAVHHSFKCSCCKTHWDYPYNYCPHCGAAMLESEDAT